MGRHRITKAALKPTSAELTEQLGAHAIWVGTIRAAACVKVGEA